MRTEVLWDYNIAENTDEKRLAKKALSSSLTKPEELRLIDILKEEPEKAISLGFKPNTLAGMVEAFPELARQILIGLTDHASIHEYYVELMKMPFTRKLSAMLLMIREVIEVPLPYVELFIVREIERQVQLWRTDEVDTAIEKQTSRARTDGS
ncbi:MAG: hypothetical protein P4M11_13270 [Candidatus Pacebacteria bacterium]|nr:hypothetical protein [Candidatus Paceibacterota bacterium]